MSDRVGIKSRMQDNTSPITLATLLWQKYSLTEAEVRKLPRGYKNTSFLILNNGEPAFVLKIYAQNFLSQAAIEERSQIVSQLENSGLPVLTMVRGLDGNFCQTLDMPDGETYFSSVSKYVEVPFGEVEVNLVEILEVSQTLRSMHKALSQIGETNTIKTFEPVTVLQSLMAPESLARIDDYFVSDPKRAVRKAEVTDYYQKKGLELLEYFQARKADSTLQLIHGDFNLGNFLMQDSKICKIFDFDEMVRAPKEYEIALTIYHLDYGQMTYLDRLIELFVSNYYDHAVDLIMVQDIVMFMKFRAFYRFARFFTYYQFTEKHGGHFIKFRNILDRLDELDPQEIFGYLVA